MVQTAYCDFARNRLIQPSGNSFNSDSQRVIDSRQSAIASSDSLKPTAAAGRAANKLILSLVRIALAGQVTARLDSGLRCQQIGLSQ